MPTYEYLCQSCSHRFETWQKMADEPLTVCPECGNHIRRVLFPAGVVFKGSGFYKTDSAKAKAAAIPAGNNGEHAADTKTNGEQKSTESGKSSESSKNGQSGENGSNKTDSTSSTSTAATTTK